MWRRSHQARPKAACAPTAGAAVDRLRRETGAPAVHIVAHSAGGWLARAFIADERFGAPAGGTGPNPGVRSIVTLGTPHLAPPEGEPPLGRPLGCAASSSGCLCAAANAPHRG